MGYPNLIVEIAFTTDPWSTAPVWVDVTEDVLGFEFAAGRHNELGRVDAGEGNIMLDNSKRKFDPTNTASPYSPNVIPGRRCRARATWNAVTYPILDIFIESWPPRYPLGPSPAKYSEVTASGRDAFAMFADIDLETLGDAILADEPVAYWRLDETSGLTAQDSGPNNLDGTYVGGVALGQAGPLPGQTCPSFDGVNDRIDFGTPAALQLTGDLTIEAWIYVAPLGTGQTVILECGDAFTQNFEGTPWEFQRDGTTLVFGAVQGQGTVAVDFFQTPNTALLEGWNHVAVTRQGRVVRMYARGVQVSEHIGQVMNPGVDGFAGVHTMYDVGTQWTSGKIAHIAAYNKALTGGRIAAHAAARLDRFAAAQSDAILNAILDAIGWPAAWREINGGNTRIQAHTPTGKALEAMQKVAVAENGLLYMTGDNKVGFHSRHSIWTTHNTSLATFGDAAGELPYQEHEPQFDRSNLWTASFVERAGGVAQYVEADVATRQRHGTRVLREEGLLLDSDLEAFDRAHANVAKYKTPRLRIPAITLDGNADDALWPQILGRSYHFDRITLHRRPPDDDANPGPMIEQQSRIEGLKHSVWRSNRWRTEWTLSPADDQPMWILGDATYGVLGSARLGY